MNIANRTNSLISNYDETLRQIYRYHGSLVILQLVCDGVIREYTKGMLFRDSEKKNRMCFSRGGFPDYIYGHCGDNIKVSNVSEYIDMCSKRDGYILAFFSTRLSIMCILFSCDNELLFSILYYLFNSRAR